MARESPSIAIVGMAGVYPDADSPEELFENVIAGRRAFRRIPEERLPLDQYGSTDPADVDATYLTQAAVIEGYEFDRLRFKIVGSTYRSADLTHWLALDVADRALRDAGFDDGTGLPRDTTGVLLGNTLTGEFSRAQALRLRWPYVKSLVGDAIEELLPADADRAAFLDRLETRYKAPFEPFGDESLAGGLSNTIAGRICNQFDLHGGGYTLDGACSSSLLAVANACNALVSSDLDVALAGGVDLSLDPFELIGFSRAGALAPTEMRVYEERSEGFWPGEGCGFLVLMRESDALAEGRRIHARIRGWGISSDGAGGISRPEQSGQLLAMRRAYARAGFGPETVGYFEGHGTGTVVGDATELGALTQLLRESCDAAKDGRPVPIGSVKANIGHTKAAAGVAGLIKAAIAVRDQIVPGMPGCEHPHELVDPGRGALLRVPRHADAWPADRALRAGVSSMGFGGINAHVVVDASPGPRVEALSARQSALAASSQDAELFVFSAEDRPALRRRIASIRSIAGALSRAELADLAATVAAANGPGPTRAAVVASRPDELAARLDTLLGWLNEDSAASARISETRGIFLGDGATEVRIGFLFPGQGAPVREELGLLAARFPELPAVRAAIARGRDAAPVLARSGNEAVDTEVAQPCIVAASLASAEALAALGVQARVAVGHSLGEITALGWAEALQGSEAVELAALRGGIMSAHAQPGGAMASLAVGPEEARALIGQAPCTVAGHNGPKRSVISGPVEAVDEVLARARQERIGGARLAVSHAFHSPLVAACARPFAESLTDIALRPPERILFSTRTGAALERACDLPAHLVAQLTEPVRFAEALDKAAGEVDLLVEVGPGRMLSGLAREALETPVVATDTGGPGGRGFLSAVAAAWALGTEVDVGRLFEGRVTKAIDLERGLRFFANPAAQPLAAKPPGEEGQLADESGDGGGERGHWETALGLVTWLVAQRCELPAEAVGSADRFLSDLHLTSIAVSTIASEAARELGRPPLVAPNEFADATVSELAEAIDSEDRVLGRVTGVPGVQAWLRAFEVCTAPRARPRRSASADVNGRRAERHDWRVFSAGTDGFADEVAERLRRDVAPGGVLLHLPYRDAEANVPILLAAAKAAIQEMEARLFVLVHHGDAGVAVARSLHQEARSLATRVVQVPERHPDAIDLVVAEAQASAGYLECAYDESGRRDERCLRVLPIEPGSDAPLPLGADDVLLVTGGGKGIAAECALGLARESGCALGLIGRSSPGSDEELSRNLDRLRAASIRVAYSVADITDHEAVASAIDALESELGPVTALIHGAGLNSPASLVALEPADFNRTLAPKLGGLENLIDRLDGNALRFVVGFGSVIAQLGLPGEADYAWANELMSRRIEDFAAEHPETRCHSLEWSIWSGVGMGERLGRVETLAAMNIASISPDEGVAWLCEILRHPEAPVRTFLSGRFGSPPTLSVDERPLPVGRFLERVREYTPGVELVVDSELSFESDPYVADHVYRGDAILPGVMGLEAMSQVAHSLQGESRPPVIEQVEFLQAIDVPPSGKRVVRVAGLVKAPGLVELRVRSDASDFQIDHLRASFRFGGAEEEALSEAEGIPPQAAAPALDPAHQLYGDLFFHRGRFARVKGYRSLGSRHCDAEIACRDERFFGAFQPQRLWLGDAGARDAAVHAIQACVPDREILPVAVERIEAGTLPTSSNVWLRARERWRGDGEYVYDITLTDDAGVSVERWFGLRLREVAAGGSRRSWPAGLLAPRIEALAREYLGDASLRAALVPGVDREASRRGVTVARGVDCRLAHRPDGKPVVDEGSVSVSHALGHTLAVVSDTPIACDIEGVENRTSATWADLLGPDRERLARHLSNERTEAPDASATRLWGALECLQKLGVQRDAPLVVTSDPADECVRLRAGDLAVVSLLVEVADSDVPMVLTLVGRGEHARL